MSNDVTRFYVLVETSRPLTKMQLVGQMAVLPGGKSIHVLDKDDDAAHLLDALRETHCIYCGCPRSNRPCTCTRDE